MFSVKTAKNKMTLPKIKAKAKSLALNPGKMKKAELIRAIQTAENYSPCYGTSNGYCDQSECCFLDDCLKLK